MPHPNVYPRFLKAGTESISVYPRFLVDGSSLLAPDGLRLTGDLAADLALRGVMRAPDAYVGGITAAALSAIIADADAYIGTVVVDVSLGGRADGPDIVVGAADADLSLAATLTAASTHVAEIGESGALGGSISGGDALSATLAGDDDLAGTLD